MKKITLIALCAAMAVPAMEASVADALNLRKRVKARTEAVAKPEKADKKFAARAAEASAKWCAGTQKTYGWDGEDWALEQTYISKYDSKGLVTTEDVTDIEGYVTRTTNTWNENGMLATRLTQVAETPDEEFTNSSKLSRVYDGRVTDFITVNEQYTWSGEDWMPSNYYTQTITRNEAGNITLMERAVYFDGILDPVYRLEVTYGEDGKASSIQSSDLTYDYATGQYVWENGSLVHDIVWEETDGQILSDEDLFEGANRAKSLVITDEEDGMVMYFTAEYGENGSYVLTGKWRDEEEGDDIQAVMYYTVLDENGSCRIVTETTYSYEGEIYWYDSYTENYRYDAYGLILLEEVQYSDGTYGEVESRIEGTVEYDREHGYPLNWTIREMEYESGEMENTFRAEFSDYVEAGMTGISSVNADANAPVEFYTLQGVKVENPSAGNIYIRRQGSDVTKMLMK